MIHFNKNNLDRTTSPYLQQHKENPIHWQEWSKEVLRYAKENNKIIFVSVGYATCHWCHVMAMEAFSDRRIADYLNEQFVSIKVDREQRPDIDNYMMSFLQETQGQGGWPLNVFLTPDGRPILALTYMPIEPRYGMVGFFELLHVVKENYDKYGREIQTYFPAIRAEEPVEEREVIRTITENLSQGFGAQFPPHNTLLFLLHYYQKNKDENIKQIIEKILDTMAMRGLHDHLQGGFYRYCVDASWTIPHFEKMLYDQAMMLWVYSTAYKVLMKSEYKTIVEKIIVCLEQTYAHEGLYYAAHDADTGHQEGITYVWTKGELQKHLTQEEFNQFARVYDLTENFEENIHLIKKINVFLPNVEKKILGLRKKRKQPFTDLKIVTSWNALTGIGLIHAFRSLGDEALKARAVILFKTLLEKHYHNGVLYHSSLNGEIQREEFLEDYAASLLFATYLYEETNQHKELVKEWCAAVHEFRNHYWAENKSNDFTQVPAQTFDHPVPSSVSLAEMALWRAGIILN